METKTRRFQWWIVVSAAFVLIIIGYTIFRMVSPVKVFFDSPLRITLKHDSFGWQLYRNCAGKTDELWLAEQDREPRRTTRIAIVGKTPFSEDEIQETLEMIRNMVQENSDRHNCGWMETSDSIEVFFCMEEGVYGVYDSMACEEPKMDGYRLVYRDWIEVPYAEEHLDLNGVKKLMKRVGLPMYRDYERLVEGQVSGIVIEVMKE